MSRSARTLFLCLCATHPNCLTGSAFVTATCARVGADGRISKLIMRSVSPAISTLGGETRPSLPVASRSSSSSRSHLHKLPTHPQLSHNSTCAFLPVLAQLAPFAVPHFLFFSFLGDLMFHTGNNAAFPLIIRPLW